MPAEAAGSAPGRGRLTGRRVLVVGAGTRPSPEPDPPPGNGRAISVLAAREVPSLVDTPLGREASRLNPGRTARRLPFGRQATAWEVAYATVWLLSGESSYVNAHPLVLDGGATSFG
jgi:hypothetical protein